MSAVVVERAVAADHFAPEHGSRRRRRYRLVVAVAIVLVLVNGLFVWNLLATKATADSLKHTQATTADQLAHTRHDLAVTRGKLASAVANLRKQTAARDHLLQTGAATRAAARQAAAEVKQTLDRISAQQFQAGSLANCLTKLQAAMNALSTGDATSAAGALNGVDASCPAGTS